MRLRGSVAASLIRNPLYLNRSTKALKRIAFGLSGYTLQASSMLSICSFMSGDVGGSVIFGGFRRLAGLVLIQPLSCTNRKNARNASSFFRAASSYWTTKRGIVAPNPHQTAPLP
jgi:hypothetical protein